MHACMRCRVRRVRASGRRYEKRLSTLQSVRPAYMDEYERLQGELNALYTQYLDRFRCGLARAFYFVGAVCFVRVPGRQRMGSG